MAINSLDRLIAATSRSAADRVWCSNLEARVKITENIGIVPFVDAGSYYESPVPQLGRTLLYGVGLGLRYYTGFGPLRVDLATPMHKRNGDSPIQIYISLGQAF
jgi:translocation and assembly module TamA